MTTIADRVLWIDLETTGSDEEQEDAAILEAAIQITTGPDLYRDIASNNWVYRMPRHTKETLERWDEVVLDMHMKSGLLKESLKSTLAPPDGSWTNHIIGWVAENLDKPEINLDEDSGTKIPYGGSGVAHFDRRWIKRFLPDLDSILTHWALDVGVVRRLHESARSKHILKLPDKEHRALPDARRARDEWVHYFNLVKEMEEA